MSFNDTTAGLAEGTPYYYRVWATNSYGDSGYTNISSDTTLPATPTTFVATRVDGSQVNLTWNDNSAIETGYSIEQLMPDGITWQEIQTTDAGTGTGTMNLAVTGAFEPLTDVSFPSEGVSGTRRPG